MTESNQGQDYLQLLRQIVALSLGTNPDDYLGMDETQLCQFWNRALYDNA